MRPKVKDWLTKLDECIKKLPVEPNCLQMENKPVTPQTVDKQVRQA